MKKIFPWYFAISCLGYVPIVCDITLKLIRGENISIWLTFAMSLIVCLLIFLISYNTRQVLSLYGTGVSAFSLALKNLNKYFAVVAAAGALVDYLLTASLMAIYFAYSLEGLLNNDHLHYSVFIACMVLLLAALLSFRKIKIHVTFIKVFFLLFVTLIFGAILIVVIRHLDQGNIFNQISFQTLTGESRVYLEIFVILKLFSYMAVCAVGFDSMRLNSSVEIKADRYIGIYITAIIVSVTLSAVLFLAQSLGIDPTHEDITIYQIIHKVMGRELYSLIALVFISAAMFVCTSTSFALVPAFCEELAKEKFFPTLFKNSKDDFMYLNGILLTLFFAVLVVVITRGEIKALLEIYAIGAFIAIGIGQLSLFFSWKGKGKFPALVGAVLSLIIVVIFSFAKFLSGAWIVLIIIAILSRFMIDVNNYYNKVDKELALARDGALHKLRTRNVSIVIITDIDKGIVPAVRYAQAISPDMRAVYVSGGEDNEKTLLEDWEYYFPEIPLVVLKDEKKNNVIIPIMNYIKHTRKEQSQGIVTVVIPEYIPQSAFYSLFHRNYAFILRVILGFKKGIVTTGVPYWSEKNDNRN
ncbi:MAG: amino acid permease [Abditibacteriota bacterium]|nr:amino acid permease [Abditibacteriota bacterium]